MPLRILSWNCRRASASNPLWKYLLELSPDIALLQEVSALPTGVSESYQVRSVVPLTKAGGQQRFHSVMLVRGAIAEPVLLRSGIEWVDTELQRFAGNLLSFRVAVDGFMPLTVVGVYSPPWPVARDRLIGQDLSLVKLTQNPDVWVTDLLVAALRQRSEDGSEWVVAGDFNACESFDSWKGGPRGNREWLDRMATIGFTDCLRQYQGALTPTYRKPGTLLPHAQLDYLFVTSGLTAKLRACATGDLERVYGSQLSDHLPVIADFSEPVPQQIQV
ncbi:hypothetical protein H6G89_33330 [Oscillatoria sp. FACHB-1407]|uniref:endonuclease/exonuclease/phosphatase family protein n=1 Tax=Oscillatoria sp. FACHB-1407 TaxID=2692847 RepID=UPI001687B291|nr:endonuclease/exonuclease/phosphatase family protein [Oscillatoria sp. FACHB-1407]MBD2465874.1 hypothetical protein [Oscillatoria sp. FACHB-1407]